MKEITTLELAKILQSNDPEVFFTNADYENILESTTSQLIQLLIAVKEKKIQNSAFKDPDEISAVRLLNSVIAKINTRRENTINFTLPAAIQNLYFSQKLFVQCPLAFSFGDQEDLKKYERDLVNIVEQWISYLKSIYTKLGHFNRSFPEEKAFWLGLRSELDSIHNFSVSEEYEFIIEMLKRIGKLSLMYTLIMLINDQKIYKICEAFHSVYSNFEFSYVLFLKHSNESPIVLDDRDTHPSNNVAVKQDHLPFVSNILIIFKILRNLRKMPRIIRKSISSNLNALRTTIVNETLVNFHPTFYEIYAEYTSLALYFNLQNDKDSGDSRITIDHIKDFSKYISSLNSIYKASELFQYISDSENSLQFLELIKTFEFEFKKALFENEIQHNASLPVNSRSPLDSDFVTNLLKSKGNDFINQNTNSLSKLRHHFKNHRILFEFKIFESIVSKYVVNILKTVLNCSLANSLNDTICEHSGRTVNIPDIVDVILTALTLKSILCNCSEAKEFFELKASKIKNIIEIYERYIASLPSDLLETTIINTETNDNIGTENNDDINKLELNESVVGIVDMEDQLTRMYETIISEDNNLPLFDIKLLEDVRFIKPRLEGLKGFLNEYKNEVRQCGSIFYNEEIEEYFKGHVGLKWRYYSEETQNQERCLYERFKKKKKQFYMMLEELKSEYIPKIMNEDSSIGNGRYEPCDVMCLFDGFDRNQVEEALIKKRDEILEIILTIVKEKMSKSRHVLQLAISKDAIQLLSNDVVVYDIIQEYILRFSGFEKLLNISACIKQLETDVQNELDIIKQAIDEMAENHTLCCKNEKNESSKTHLLSILETLQKTRRNEELHRQLSLFQFFEINFKFDSYSFSAQIKSIFSQLCFTVSQYKIAVRSSLLSLIQEFSSNNTIPLFIDSFILQYGLLRCFDELHYVLSLLHENTPEDAAIHALLNIGSENTILSVFDNRYAQSSFTAHKNIQPEIIENLLLNVVFDEATGILDEASIRSVIHNGVTFKLKQTLTQDEFELLSSKKHELESKISEISSIYHNFPCDEDTFLPYLSQFRIKCDALSRDIAMFNELFIFYKFEALSFNVSTEVLEAEYKTFREMDQNIKKFMRTKISTFIEQLANGCEVSNCRMIEETVFSKLLCSFNTQLMKNFVSQAESLKLPLSYLKELSKFNISHSTLNLEGNFKDYIDSFDEKQMRISIEKIKMDIEISKFLSEERPRLTDLIKISTVGSHSYVSNISELSSILNAQRSMLDLTVKFNKFNLYKSELDQVDDLIKIEQECFDILCSVQDKVFELGMILSKEGTNLLDLELLKYNRSKVDFENLISRSSVSSSTDVLNKLKNIRFELDSISNGINAAIDVLRHKCNRLYFIPNTDLVRSMSSTKGICWLLTSIFNINEIITEDECIIGISSGVGKKKEKVSLVSKINLNDNLENIVNGFERSLKQTLKSTFLNKIGHAKQSESGNDFINQSISIVDELVCEYNYFNGKSKEKSYRAERIEAYSEKFPDLMKTIQKYTISSENMPLDKNSKDILDIILKVDDLEYSFEYYPPTDFIFTYLTAKIFTAISLSKDESGVIFYGPSGTGKTESVKYYCRSVGKPLFVFCCNENCDFESLRNIIIGCELTGSYICFDEFNRLKKDVMSSITELLYEKKGW